MKKQYGIDSMPETAENVAAEFGIARADQDAFALRSQQRCAAAQARGYFQGEIAPVTVPGRKGDTVVAADEHPRETTLEALAKLAPIVKPDGTVTAGNASGVNDGAIATLIASGAAVAKYGLKPMARIRGAAAAGVDLACDDPRVLAYLRGETVSAASPAREQNVIPAQDTAGLAIEYGAGRLYNENHNAQRLRSHGRRQDGAVAHSSIWRSHRHPCGRR
jgi:hypothetical protein